MTRQTKKRRPLVPVPECVGAWLDTIKGPVVPHELSKSTWRRMEAALGLPGAGQSGMKLIRRSVSHHARSALMPTEQDALNLMHDCYQRLKELGWNDAIYCPKDGSEFDAIEAGSTGIHRCHYDGDWPNGHWWVADDHDLWPSRPILYRVSEEEKARYREGAKKIAEMMRDERAASVQTAAESATLPHFCRKSRRRQAAKGQLSD